MQNTKLREEHRMIELYERHVDMVYRICFSYLKNTMDTEDMVQNTFIRLLDRPVEFENEAHEKAWLIVTARNLCRNHLKSWWQKNTNLEEEMYHLSMEEEADQNLLEMVMKLPEKYRVTLYLYYYEGYDSEEIAKLMEKPSSTVRNYLQRGRDRLKVMLGEDIFEKQ
ncbi:RNA polymerase sigma factor [Proteiniclasticum sp. C24MP]|uniref:RNA polymerase sigma factor n=1 Tax=Proteiniclasticum sp. C24MP TaxID=3374101 RepID=UPI003754118C